MLFARLRRQFTASHRTEDRKSISTVWIADRDHSTCISPKSGKMHAYIQQDRHGMYYPTVVVSSWRALKLIRKDAATVLSLRPFPRCTIELRKLACETLGLAEQQAQYGLGLYD